jgi:cysteine desulfurase family protein (TIGR01976 family)
MKTTTTAPTFTHPMALKARQQFPALQRRHQDLPVVFFDGPAGTHVPTAVIDAMASYLRYHNANHGGVFVTSRETDAMLEKALEAFADFVGAASHEEIIFGQNMTSLTFAFSRALSKTWQAGDEIIVTALDHDANVTPWVMAAAERQVKVHTVPIRMDDYTLDLASFRSALSPRTRLVAVGCASNATGGINPVKQLTAWAHEFGAEVFLDAVHYGPHGLIDVQDWNCDYLACSAYKFFGPHLGILWGRAEKLRALTPFKVRPASNDIPWRWMTGTQSHEAIAGGLAAVEYLADIGRDLAEDAHLERREALQVAMQAIQRYETGLIWQLISALGQIPGIKIYGITSAERTNERFSTVSFTHNRLTASQIATALAERGICVWHGNYYALQFTEACGLEPEGMVRVGLVHYNTAEEVNRLVRALAEITSETVQS